MNEHGTSNMPAILIIGAFLIGGGILWVYDTSRPSPGASKETIEKAYPIRSFDKPTDPARFLADLDRLQARMSKEEVGKTIRYLSPSADSNFVLESVLDTCGGLWTLKAFFARDREDNVGLDTLQIIAKGPDARKCARCMEKQLRLAYGKPEDGRKILADFERTFGPTGVRPDALLYFTKGRDRMEFDTVARESVRLHRHFR